MQQNFLSPLGFAFKIGRLPNVEFFVQGASVPGVSMGTTTSPTPFKSIHLAGDKLEYDPFTVTLRVDENMHSYEEILNWMIGLAKPSSFDEYKGLKNSDDGLYSDASLIILNSNQNPNIEFSFKKVFPTSLSNINMDVTAQGIVYVTCEVTFQHNGFELHRLH
jgi:hypothetical protein